MLPNPGSTEDVSSTSSEAENDGLILDGAAAQTGENESAAQSSAAADAKETVSEKDWDPLSVVKKAVGKDQDDEGAQGGDPSKQTDGSSESGKDGQKDGAAELPKDVTAEELGTYKGTTRKRIESLLDDRQRLTERLTAREPLAEQMEVLQGFMQERQLTSANVSELLVVGGLAMSADPKDLKAALVRVDQFRDQIRSQLGEVLPEDLQKKVDDGLLDADSAKEVALSRVTTQRAERTVETATQQVSTVDETAKVQAVHTTIADWQSQKFASDPDYPRKAALLSKELRLRVAAEPGGRVLDTARALKIADEAYAEVNTIMKALVPANPLPAKRVVTSKSPSGKMASAPASALDAARAGLAKAR